MENKNNTQADLTKISIGGGLNSPQGFKRVDLDPLTNPDFLMDASCLEFSDSSIDVIYASHVLEHLRPAKGLESGGRDKFLIEVLRNWRKALKPGGLLYVAVPDSLKLCTLLTQEKQHQNIEKAICDALMGGARNSFDYHYSAFTQASLTKLLEDAGFSNIGLFESFCPDESESTILGTRVSLNLRAVNASVGDLDHQQPIDLVDIEVAPQVSDLALFRRAADERLKIIRDLEKICEERLSVIEVLEKARLAGIEKSTFLETQVKEFQSMSLWQRVKYKNTK